MYSSIISVLSSGMRPTEACCSLKYDTKERDDPASMSKSLHRWIMRSSSDMVPMSLAISPLNMATSMERSKLLGSISPAHDGTVGFLPDASFTKAIIPLDLTNSKDLPPRTKMSPGDSLSTNFSESSPTMELRLVMTR